MGVDADEQWTGDPTATSMLTDRLADRQDMRLVEGANEGRSAMARGPEGNTLRRHRLIRLNGEIGRHQPRHVHQQRRRCQLARQRADLLAHSFNPQQTSRYSAIWRPTSRNASGGRSNRSGALTALRYITENTTRRHPVMRGGSARRTTSSW